MVSSVTATTVKGDAANGVDVDVGATVVAVVAVVAVFAVAAVDCDAADDSAAGV